MEKSKFFLMKNNPANTIPVRSQRKTTARILDFVITFGLFMIFLGVPIFFSGLSFQGVVFDKQIYFYFWFLLILVAWVSKGVIEEEMEVKRTSLDIPLLILWVIILASSIFSIDRWHSFWGYFGDPSRGFLPFTAFLIFYYVFLSNFNWKRFYWVISGLTISGFILILWSFLSIFEVHFFPEQIASFIPVNLFATTSGLGIFLAALLPIYAVLILKINSDNFSLRNRNTSIKIFFDVLNFLLFFLILADLFLILVLHNFIYWPAVLIGFGFFLMFILSKLVKIEGKWGFLPFAMFFVLLVLVMTRAQFDTSRFSSVFSNEVSLDYKISKDIAVQSLKEKAFLGAGPGNYGYIFSLFRPRYFNENMFYQFRFFQGSGMFFESLSTIGLAGTVVTIFLILLFLNVCLYLLIKNRDKNKFYSLGIFSSVVTLIIFSALRSTEGTILFLIALLSALLVGVIYQESEIKIPSLRLSFKYSSQYALALSFVFMAVSVGVVYLFVFIGKTWMADALMAKAQREKLVSTDEKPLEKMFRASNLNPREGIYQIKIGQEYMRLANREISEKKKEDQDLNKITNYLNFSIAASQKGYDLLKNNIVMAEALAQIYENASLYVPDIGHLAEDYYKRSAELEPQNPLFDVKLGQIRMKEAALKSSEKEKEAREAELKKALEYFNKSIEKKKQYDPGYYYVAVTQDALGNLDAAIENMNKAVVYTYASNSNYFLTLGFLYLKKDTEDGRKIAGDIFRRVISLDEKNADAHYGLGVLNEKNKNNEEAIKEYEKAAEILPENQKDLKEILKKMIDNLRNGISNLEAQKPMPSALVEPSATAEEVAPVESNFQTPAPELTPKTNP